MNGDQIVPRSMDGQPWSTVGATLDGFRPLLPAEEVVLSRLPSGGLDRLGDGVRPGADDPARAVRASFLRFLLLGGEEGYRPHEKGVRISGAWIQGVLDLEGCRVSRDIRLKDCRFDAVPVFRSAIIDRLFLDGSSLPGFQAERLEVRGGLYLRGSHANGEVRLTDSRLGGNLVCDGAVIQSPGGFALNAEGLEVRNVFCRDADFRGGVNLRGARLEASFDCAGSTIFRPDEVAIAADAIQVQGGFLLRSGNVTGEVRLTGARIAGDLDCTSTVITNSGRDALQLSRVLVEGAFFLRKEARIDGTLAMTGASVGTLHDEAPCWPKKGELLLNRCRYGAFIDGPVDAEGRLEWLSRQVPDGRGEEFWPQPYEQLASVFREMGHDEDATTVLIEKERLQRRARRRRARHALWRAMLAVKDGLLAITVAYGRQPLLALVWLAFFWALGVAVFGYAERQGAFKPNSAVVLRSPEWTMCGVDRSEQRFLSATQTAVDGRAESGQTQFSCFRQQWEASSYPEINPWMYSLDVLLPVLEMDQKTYWRPDPSKPSGGSALSYYYFQSIVGWVLSLLAVAGFSGIVRSR
ncbi:hypothetical protein [Microvirga zambiensis]|uniref:hypothetical protein n=1 Tax=Microvirga zambiensis TaxID=1402137 RepID=UPI001FE5A2C5|nr:hypothetical protein [Microvirga zambiensis]